MKKKYLLTIMSFVFTWSCKAQLNELTQSEYHSIKFNNVTLKSIMDTNADLKKMKMLFGDNLSHKEVNNILVYKQFWNKNLDINFNNESDNDYYVSDINVYDSLVRVTVKGITAKIGDMKSVFGDSIAINTNNGDYSVVFTDSLTGAAALAFKIDKITDKIISIEFNVYD